jgi:hypothetical protein
MIAQMELSRALALTIPPSIFPSRRRFYMELSPTSDHSSRRLIPLLFETAQIRLSLTIPSLSYRVRPRIPSLIPSPYTFNANDYLWLYLLSG